MTAVAGMPAEGQLLRGLTQIVDSGVVGLLLWDVTGRIHDANAYFLEVVGYSREDLVAGRLSWSALSPPGRHALDQASLERLAQDGFARGDERELVRRDGTPIFV